MKRSRLLGGLACAAALFCAVPVVAAASVQVAMGQSRAARGTHCARCSFAGVTGYTGDFGRSPRSSSGVNPERAKGRCRAESGPGPEPLYGNAQLDGKGIRQLLGSCNLDGPPLLHLMSGNLSYQIEHHLFPDVPSNRYAEIAPRVREICERYELPYTSGSLPRQYAQVIKRLLRLALPGGGDAEPVEAEPLEPPNAAELVAA